MERTVKTMNRRWSEPECRKLLEMKNKGYTFNQIGNIIGRTEQSCRQNYLRLTFMKKKIRNDTEKAEKIKELTEKCMTIAEIANELNIKKWEVTEIKKEFGIRTTKEQLKKIKSKPSSCKKDTICWECKNAMVNCKKPVKGFKAEKITWGNCNPPKYSYMVSSCPNFVKENYA